MPVRLGLSEVVILLSCFIAFISKTNVTAFINTGGDAEKKDC